MRLLLHRRYVLLGWGGALAEEILLHLFDDGLLVLAASRIEAILVQQHFAEFGPARPGFSGDVVVDLLSEFRVKGWLIQARKFFVQLDTENLALRHSSPRHSIGKIISYEAEQQASGFRLQDLAESLSAGFIARR
jgi:hypothetical protein